MRVLLLEGGADVNKPATDGSTARHTVCNTYYNPRVVESVRILLKHHADPNKGRIDGMTPLHAAVYRGHIEAVRLLFASGACVDPVNDVGETPLDLARRYSRLDIAQALLDTGARVPLTWLS